MTPAGLAVRSTAPSSVIQNVLWIRIIPDAILGICVPLHTYMCFCLE